MGFKVKIIEIQVFLVKSRMNVDWSTDEKGFFQVLVVYLKGDSLYQVIPHLAFPPSSLVSHKWTAALQFPMTFTNIISFPQQSIFCCFHNPARVQILVHSVTEYTVIPWVWLWDNQMWGEPTMLKVPHQWCGQFNMWPSGLTRAYALPIVNHSETHDVVLHFLQLTSCYIYWVRRAT